MGLLASGNAINRGCAYEDERSYNVYKYQFRQVMALVRIPNTSFVNTFDIVIPSREKDVPDIPLIIPAGAYVYYIGIRLGSDLEQLTAGNGIKIANAIGEGANNLIITAGVPLAPDNVGFIAQYPNSPNNPVNPQLGLKATPYIPKLYSTNPGGTALGGGIRSRNINGGFIGIELCWYDVEVPAPMEAFLAGIPRS